MLGMVESFRQVLLRHAESKEICPGDEAMKARVANSGYETQLSTKFLQLVNETCHEKTGLLPMRKQWRRSAL